jgi:hypothetical protein
MQPAPRPEADCPPARTTAFPAPLCDACNVAMKLNGEYRASDASSASRREYQCALCGAPKLVRRIRRHG